MAKCHHEEEEQLQIAKSSDVQTIVDIEMEAI
jgi:hypothetical protein